ncbi:MAG: glycosyltransferase [Methylomicrobium sp.]
MITAKRNPGLRVLITNNTLASRAGSELYVYEVALALLRRGYNPIAYSSTLGEVAEELRRATVPVIDNLNALTIAPDLIHGQHHLDAMTAMLRFPQTPALYFCHGWLPWEELPPIFPSILRYIAVDDLCRERLLTTSGISPEKIKTLYNFVDLTRFKARQALPEKPRSALIFSNYAAESNFVGKIRAACRQFGIERIDVAGLSSGRAISNPEEVLPEYDIVFAKARCALEAMAIGCAVIVADFPGLGGMVTTENLPELRRLNFGVRTMQSAPLTEENIFDQLNLYNASDARKVSEYIRDDADIEKAIDKLEDYYIETLSEAKQQMPALVQTWSSAASNYLYALTPAFKTRVWAEQKGARADWLSSEVQALTERNERLQNRLVPMQIELEAIRNSYALAEQKGARADGLSSEVQALTERNEQLQNRLSSMQIELEAIRNSYALAEQEDARLSREVQTLAEQNEYLQNHLKATQTDLEAIRTSRTWKAFADYRKLRKWLRGKSD